MWEARAIAHILTNWPGFAPPLTDILDQYKYKGSNIFYVKCVNSVIYRSHGGSITVKCRIYNILMPFRPGHSLVIATGALLSVIAGSSKVLGGDQINLDTAASCAQEVAELVLEVTSSDAIEFCPDFHPGWKFMIHPFSGYEDTLLTGDISQVLSLNFNRNSESGELLKYGLVPVGDNPELYIILIISSDGVLSQIGPDEYFMWAQDLRSEVADGKWGSTSLFRCTTSIGGGCISYQNAIVCDNYSYGGTDIKATPVISV
ncbi:hypothetical protein [Paenirhodobacter sp.]|uniref:hypothetical protein n=1 Tax=Paenirhodobacter sp. TaxID=1965326 RepID=UPI003B41DEA8